MWKNILAYIDTSTGRMWSNCQQRSHQCIYLSISDYCLAVADCTIQRGDIERSAVTSSKYKRLDLKAFKNDLKFDWSENSALEELLQEYKCDTEKCSDKHAPAVTRRVTTSRSSLLGDYPKREIKRLQRIQNLLAKLVFGKKKKDSATLCLKNYIGCRFTYA